MPFPLFVADDWVQSSNLSLYCTSIFDDLVVDLWVRQQCFQGKVSSKRWLPVGFFRSSWISFNYHPFDCPMGFSQSFVHHSIPEVNSLLPNWAFPSPMEGWVEGFMYLGDDLHIYVALYPGGGRPVSLSSRPGNPPILYLLRSKHHFLSARPLDLCTSWQAPTFLECLWDPSQNTNWSWFIWVYFWKGEISDHV